MHKIFTQIRGYFEECTVSDLIDPYGEKIGYALEDIGRPPNVKIYGKTCIPEGIYEVAITFSNRYQKDMIQLYNVEEGLKVEKDGISFEGIRVHGGNDVDDSHGCPLVAANFDGDQRVWGSLSKTITAEVKRYLDANYKVLWCITSR